ncbi:YihY/virulence factor BrkB family protein [Nocardioides pacificus]
MSDLASRASRRLETARLRRPLVDHAVRMVQHYLAVKGNVLAGSITYYGFLSFFPILALSFFVVGFVAKAYPEVRIDLVRALNEVLPGILGPDEGDLSLADIEDAAGAVGLVGFVAGLYTGLGWLSAMRNGLRTVFELPDDEQPSFVAGKLRDLLTLVVVGAALLLSVTVSGFVRGFSEQALELVRLGTELAPLLLVLTIVIGVAASALLFYLLFRLLADSDTPRLSLWKGALLGALSFELLKELSGLLLASTRGQPAFQAFGIALIVAVWINYFSRVVLFAASWAHTAKRARLRREREQEREAARIAATRVELRKLPGPRGPSLAERGKIFAAGGAATLALVAIRRRKDPHP